MSTQFQSLLFLKKSRVNTLLITGMVAMLFGVIPIYGLRTQKAEADLVNGNIEAEMLTEVYSDLIVFHNNTLVPTSIPYNPEIQAPGIMNVVITGYSSTPDQTDETPHITASGAGVRDGIVASNYLPFGTKVRIPEIYGEKVFVVEDRMNKRYGAYHIDVWFTDTNEAIDFGVKRTYIEIL